MKRNTKNMIVLMIVILLTAAFTVISLMIFKVIDIGNFTKIHNYEASPNIDGIKLNAEDIAFMNTQFEVYQSEFAVCFKSRSTDKKHMELTRTVIISANENEITSACAKGTQLLIHSHPTGNCGHSEQDLIALEEQVYPYSGVICGVNKIKILNKSQDAQQLVRVNKQ